MITGNDDGLPLKYRLKRMMTFGGSIRLNPIGILILCVTVILLIWFNIGPKTASNIPTKNEGNSGAANGPVSETVSLKSLLAASIEMAKRGGKQVKKIREMVDIGEKSKGKTLEGVNDPFTDGDMLSHREMYYGLRKAFPLVNVISEEEDPEPIDMDSIEAFREEDVSDDVINGIADDVMVPVEDVDVWIDPLDATKEYTENLLHYVTTMVCVAVKGHPVIGVIHKPFVNSSEDATAWGWVGPNLVSKVVQREQEALRARLGGQENVHKDRDLSATKIIVSRSHKGSVHQVAERAFGRDAKVEGAGGAGYKAWEVAKGNQDVYIHVTLIKKWDICAGTALLNALGGQMTTLDGTLVDYSDGQQVKNEGGVLATMHDHQHYVDKLKSVKSGKR